MAVLEVLSVFLSPVIGLAGGFLQRKHERDIYREDTKRLVARYGHEEKLFQHEMTMTEIKGKLEAQEGEREIALADMEGSLDVLLQGIKAESDLTKIQWGKSKLGDVANFMRAAIRPTATIYLLFTVSVYAGYVLITQGLTEENRILMLAMINSLEVCLAFWFASRAGHSKNGYNDGTYTRQS